MALCAGRRRALFGSLSAMLLGACGTPLKPPVSQAQSVAEAAWQPVLLPGKRPTEYRWEMHEGRRALAARADASASMMRRRMRVMPAQLGALRFSWRVDALIPGAHVGDSEREDAPARLLLAFEGDVSRLSQRNRVMFELAEALTGERPPYATLMYVWDGSAPLDKVVINRRSDRIRKIVVDSGSVGLRQWRDHRRDPVADFRRAFGEDPGPLVGMAIMTDADNTGSKARAWYGPIDLQG